jgi:hypothetical protein
MSKKKKNPIIVIVVAQMEVAIISKRFLGYLFSKNTQMKAKPATVKAKTEEIRLIRHCCSKGIPRSKVISRIIGPRRPVNAKAIKIPRLIKRK